MMLYYLSGWQRYASLCSPALDKQPAKDSSTALNYSEEVAITISTGCCFVLALPDHTN